MTEQIIWSLTTPLKLQEKTTTNHPIWTRNEVNELDGQTKGRGRYESELQTLIHHFHNWPGIET